MGMYITDRERFIERDVTGLKYLKGNRSIVNKVLNCDLDYTPVVEIETDRGTVLFRGEKAIVNFNKHMQLLKRQLLI